MLIKRREKVGIKELKNPKALIDYSQSVNDVDENLEDYNPTKKRKILVVFDDSTLSRIIKDLFLVVEVKPSI